VAVAVIVPLSVEKEVEHLLNFVPKIHQHLLKELPLFNPKLKN
jgi:hypothetical protein